MRHIVICGLSGSTLFFHISSQTERFKKKCYWTQNVFRLFLQLVSETYLMLRRNERDIIKNVYWYSYKKGPLLSDFNAPYIFSIDFRKKYSNIKFHENPSTGSRAVPRGRRRSIQLFFAILRKRQDLGGIRLTQSDVRLTSEQRYTLTCIEVCSFFTNERSTFVVKVKVKWSRYRPGCGPEGW